MGKRSRDVSFSPSAADSSSPTLDSQPPSDSDTNEPPGKINLLAASPLQAEVMQCSLPPHRDALAFTSIESFETHYAKEHCNRCSSCSKNFPTAHFLALHIDENHNALREALQAKGEKTYACFVEDCDRRCSTPQKRRLHLIDKHMFPKDYNFRIIDNGVDRVISMLKDGQRRRISTTDNHNVSFGHRWRRSNSSAMTGSASLPEPGPAPRGLKHVRNETSVAAQTEEEQELGSHVGATGGVKTNSLLAQVDELERSMSALQFIPSSVLRKQGMKKDGA